MKIAVEGCCHGELDKIYAAMKHLEQVEAGGFAWVGTRLSI